MKNLRAIRTARKLSIIELSKITGLPQAYISRLERGVIRQPEHIEMLVEATNKSADSFKSTLS